jgi:U4/U6 small nuclear ribonucleoprotein PRP3
MSTENGERKRRRRWGDAAPAAPAPPPTATAAIDSKAKALALQESIRARLAALKAKTTGGAVPAVPAAAPAVSLKRPPPVADSAPSLAKRAKHYELDLNATAPTFNAQSGAPKPKVNPYLAHKQQNQEGGGEQVVEEDPNVDERVQASKVRKRHKPITFIEPGTFTDIAERKRQRAANAEQSGFSSGRKTGMYYSAQSMANIYGASTEVVEDDDSLVAPRAEVNDKTTIPSVLEWWDLELLPSKLKKQVGAYEGKALSKETQSQLQQLDATKKGDAQIASSQLDNEEVQDLQTRCLEQASLSYSKTAALIQHIVPIKPPNAKDDSDKKAEPTLYLTKRELKRQRKLRREEKQRELQDLQAAGLVEPPEARLTLKNFIKVLGDQAFVDPSQMEHKVMEQIQARQRAHLERNEKNKLSKEQRTAKRSKKLQEDTTGGVHVALFHVKDMSHPYHRTKVDLNAQQYNITGGVLECDTPKLACVICEGGPKAIKRYIRLMTVRMKWKGPDNEMEDDDDDDDDDEAEEEKGRNKFSPDNQCELVWTGMATKRFFKGFVFQACETSDQASKVLRAKGVGQFWDQVLTHASGRGEHFQLKLAESDDDDDDKEEEAEEEETGKPKGDDEGDVAMEES